MERRGNLKERMNGGRGTLISGFWIAKKKKKMEVQFWI
jgi:hypothetical protein